MITLHQANCVQSDPDPPSGEWSHRLGTEYGPAAIAQVPEQLSPPIAEEMFRRTENQRSVAWEVAIWRPAMMVYFGAPAAVLCCTRPLLGG